MTYMDETGFAGEQLIFVGRFHWTYDLVAFMWLLIPMAIGGAVLVVGEPYIAQYNPFPVDSKIIAAGISGALTLYGFMRFLSMMLRKRATEMLVTNRRLIFKRGIVARRIDEVDIDRVEGCNVFQSFWGRILGFGVVVVRGTGIGEIFMPPIREPLEFRRSIDIAAAMQEEERREQEHGHQSGDHDRFGRTD